MAKNRTVSHSTDGVRPRMSKMFDGRNMATRPIPLIVDSSERRAIAVAAADQKPKGKATKMPQGPRVGGVEEVFGTKVGSGGFTGGVFNPGTGLSETI